jgi:hypothetical protein
LQNTPRTPKKGTPQKKLSANGLKLKINNITTYNFYKTGGKKMIVIEY